MKKLLFSLFILIMPIANAQEIKLLFGGDVTFGDTYHSIVPSENKEYSFKKLMPLINSSDFFVVNLETAITKHDKKYPKQFNFKTKKSDLDILKAGRVNAVTIANNHTYDYGKIGLFDTFGNLEEYGIPYFGGGRTFDAARSAYRTKIKNKRFSFLAFGNNSDDTASYYVPHRLSEDLSALIKREKSFSDYVIVFFHWGKELDRKPNSEQVNLAHKCIEAGADIIIGSHPHVTQTVEVYKGKPICYSLGNFIFGGNKRGPKMGMLFMATISKNGISQKGIPIVVGPTYTKYQPYIK